MHEVFETDMPKLWADERAIRQICLNFLSNAIKFTPQGGEIWLKAGWTASGGQYLSVKDTGPGIPGGGNPDRARVVRPGLELDQIGRTGRRPRPADRQEPGRPAWRHVRAEIEAAHRHRGDRHLPAGAGDGGAARRWPSRRRRSSRSRCRKAPTRGRRRRRRCASCRSSGFDRDLRQNDCVPGRDAYVRQSVSRHPDP